MSHLGTVVHFAGNSDKIDKTMLKKIFIFLVIVLLLLIGLVYWGLNNPKATVSMITYVLDLPDSGVDLKIFKISDQQFRFQGELMINQIELEFVSEKVLYDIVIGELKIASLYRLFSENSFGAIIDITGLTVKSKLAKVEDANIMLKQEQGYNFNGTMNIYKIEAQGVTATGTKAKINIIKGKIELSDIELKVCDGSVQGSMDVYLNKPDFEVNFELTGLNSKKMEHIYPPVLSNVRGSLDGHVYVKGLTNSIESIKSDFQMKEGSKLNAVLLLPLMAYIPEKAKTEKLIIAIQNGELFSVDKAQMSAYNENDQTISSDIILKSKEMSLDVKVRVDFNVEGGIKNLLKYPLKKS